MIIKIFKNIMMVLYDKLYYFFKIIIVINILYSKQNQFLAKQKRRQTYSLSAFIVCSL